MKNLYTLLCFTFLSFLAKAQNPTNVHWAKQFVGTDTRITTFEDKQGNIFAYGNFVDSIDLDLNNGVNNLYASANNSNQFIAKYDNNANFISYINLNFAQNWSYIINSLTNNNILITGQFDSIQDFNPGVGVYNLNSTNGNQFILLLDNNFNFIQVKQINPLNSNFEFESIFSDKNSNIFFTGSFRNPNIDFDPGPGTFLLNSTNGGGIILKLDSNLNFITAKHFERINNSILGINDLEIDNKENILLTGFFIGKVDFDPSASVYYLGDTLSSLSNSNHNCFIVKLDANLNFVFAKNINSKTVDYSYNKYIEIDTNNNIYISDFFNDTVDFDPGLGIAIKSTIHWNTPYILKLDSNGNYLWNIIIDNAGGFTNTPLWIKNEKIYYSGFYRDSIDLDPSINQNMLYVKDTFGNYLVKYDVNGNLEWAKQFECTRYAFIVNCIIRSENEIIVNGVFTDSIDINPGINNLIFSKSFDFNNPKYNNFIVKLHQYPLQLSEEKIERNITLFPIPFSENLNLDLSNLENKNVDFVVYDLSGKIVLNKKSLNENKSTISFQGLNNGIYFIKIFENNIPIYQSKVIKSE